MTSIEPPRGPPARLRSLVAGIGALAVVLAAAGATAPGWTYPFLDQDGPRGAEFDSIPQDDGFGLPLGAIGADETPDPAAPTSLLDAVEQAAAELAVEAPRSWQADEAEDAVTAILAALGASRIDRPRRETVALDKPSTETLVGLFDAAGYRLGAIADGMAVPRLFVASLPHDIGELPTVDARKKAFLRTILPLVLSVNETVLEERHTLAHLLATIEADPEVGTADIDRLAAAMARYRIDDWDTAELMRRVDAVPVSLALAQAVKESGWGTSRFAQDGNALFGQWTWNDDAGLTPRNRPEGKTHSVKAFDTIIDSVTAYVLNLNTHPAYDEFRRLRATSREAGSPPNGKELAAGLERYSERGRPYVDAIRGIIRVNRLGTLDTARLGPAELLGPPAGLIMVGAR